MKFKDDEFLDKIQIAEYAHEEKKGIVWLHEGEGIEYITFADGYTETKEQNLKSGYTHDDCIEAPMMEPEYLCDDCLKKYQSIGRSIIFAQGPINLGLSTHCDNCYCQNKDEIYPMYYVTFELAKTLCF